MYRRLIFLMMILLGAAPASAADNLVDNGDWGTNDESFWARWESMYTTGWVPNWSVTSTSTSSPEGTAAVSNGTGSMGWYQIADVGPDEYVRLSVFWTGDISAGGWAEVYLFSIPKGADHAAIVNRIESHLPGDIAFVKDSSGVNPPDTWGWEFAESSPAPGGNGGAIINSEAVVVVALRLGTNGAGGIDVSWDNISLTYDTPGPTSTVFTYQGRLEDADTPADGEYDMEFKLFGFLSGEASQQGPNIIKDEVKVYDGYFTVKLDFTAAVPDIFNGESRFLEIGIRPGDLEDPNAYTVMSPRQEITPAPYALYALKADDADTVDGQHAGAFISSSADYGRSGVAANLYEGTSLLLTKYVNETGDSMTGTLTIDAGGSYGLNATGGTYGVRGEGATYGVWGYGTETEGTVYGGYFRSSGSSGRGVYGTATDNGAVVNHGGYFASAGESGRGIFAYAHNPTGENYGGKFHANGSEGRGVYGYAYQTGNSVENYGGYFETLGGSGYGIYAEAINGGWGVDLNSVYGGYFLADGEYSDAVYAKHRTSENYAQLATNDIGVSGHHFAAGTVGYLGISNYGVWGSHSVSGNLGYLGSSNTGAFGKSYSAGGVGVYGSGPSSLGDGYGVYGTCSGTDGHGGYFKATGTGGIGIEAKGKLYAGKFLGNVLICDYAGVEVLELGTGLDYAEGFDVTKDTEVTIGPGSVLIIDPDNPGKLTLSTQPYDSKVAGIVAGGQGLGSGVRLGAGRFDHDVALAGRVYCNVDATEAGIEPGDLLTTSSTPGFAMKVNDHDRAHGAIIGKAMARLEKGRQGQILVLVTLQ